VGCCVGFGPDQVLVSSGQDLDRLGLRAVASYRAVIVAVGADQIGEQLGVSWVGFCAGDVVAVAVAGHGQRVDRIHQVSGRTQRVDPQAAISFDADQYVAGFLGVIYLPARGRGHREHVMSPIYPFLGGFVQIVYESAINSVARIHCISLDLS
jgi:hypothetical protein